MNKLSDAKRAQILHCLVEGNSILATSRLMDVEKRTVLRLLCNVGEACGNYLDVTMRDLPCKRIQVDEAWTFCLMKEKRVPDKHKGELGYGDVYVWTALCPDTKIIPTFLVGRRDVSYADMFATDLALRLINRVQITSDGYRPYIEAIEKAFASKVDYAQVVKSYGGTRIGRDGKEKKCRRSECSAIEKESISGNPDPAHISTSLIERSNLTLRMGSRRFTRKTNAFSKKIQNLYYATALHHMYYNFARIHKTLRVTPAMEAGLSDHVWSLEEIANLAPIEAPSKRGPYRKIRQKAV